MRHPSEYFIRYLMTAPDPSASDNDWVSHAVVSLGYPRPDPDYLATVRAQLEADCPWNFQPKNRYHKESQKYLRDHNISALHHPDKATREAHLIVTDLKARPLIENLLLGRMEPKDIAKRVNIRLGEYFTADGIEAYGHYYWNVGLLRVEEWATLLEEYEIQRQNTLAILQVGPSMALHKAGFQTQIESKTILKEMMEGLYFDFREWKTKPHSESRTRAITSLAKAAVIVDVQLSQADSALRDSLKAFEQFRMQTAQKPVPDIKIIAPAGNFSNSGARLLEAGPVKDGDD